MVMDYEPWVITISGYIGNVPLGIGIPLYRG
jgi:hypothetical protein